ncbi:hypothetical protein C8Q79DRAFT_273875 [Trametes meyenii]|nr:hypothetical protein C8Q79DRAFT_273875 [Trametes meyenii]
MIHERDNKDTTTAQRRKTGSSYVGIREGEAGREVMVCRTDKSGRGTACVSAMIPLSRHNSATKRSRPSPSLGPATQKLRLLLALALRVLGFPSLRPLFNTAAPSLATMRLVTRVQHTADCNVYGNSNYPSRALRPACGSLRRLARWASFPPDTPWRLARARFCFVCPAEGTRDGRFSYIISINIRARQVQHLLQSQFYRPGVGSPRTSIRMGYTNHRRRIISFSLRIYSDLSASTASV